MSQISSERLTHEEVTSTKRDASSTVEVEDDISVPLLWLGGLRRGELITVHEPEAAGPDFGERGSYEGWARVGTTVGKAGTGSSGVDGQDTTERLEGRRSDPHTVAPLARSLLCGLQRLDGVDDPTSWSTHVHEFEEGAQRRVVLSPAILSRLDGLHLEARVDADHAADVEDREVLEEGPSDILAQLRDEGAKDVQRQKRQRGGDKVDVEEDLFWEA